MRPMMMPDYGADQMDEQQPYVRTPPQPALAAGAIGRPAGAPWRGYGGGPRLPPQMDQPMGPSYGASKMQPPSGGFANVDKLRAMLERRRAMRGIPMQDEAAAPMMPQRRMIAGGGGVGGGFDGGPQYMF